MILEYQETDLEESPMTRYFRDLGALGQSKQMASSPCAKEYKDTLWEGSGSVQVMSVTTDGKGSYHNSQESQPTSS